MGILTNTTAEVQEQMDGVFAEILCVDNAVASNTTGAGTVDKIVVWTANGESNNCTADFANDKITITKNGTYLIMLNASFNSSNPATTEGFIYVDGAANGSHFKRSSSSGSDIGNVSASTIVEVTSAPVDVDFRVETIAAEELTFEDMALKVKRIGV